jgi:glucose/arabinose dehydrogenase
MRLIMFGMVALWGVAEGQRVKVDELYASHCANCHGANLEGGLGGSLVDGVWKHGGSAAEILRVIAKGLPELGMVAYEEVLTPEQLRGLVIFIQEKERQEMAKATSFPVPEPDQVTNTDLHDYKIETVVAEGLEIPWAIAFLPDGRKLVTERPGALRVIDAEGKLDPRPIEGSPEVIHHGQGGLMEVAIHPNFSENGWIYLGFADGTRERNADGREEVKAQTAVVRGRIKDHKWVDQEWIFRADPEFRSAAGVHFGTRFVFHDGYIFFVVGERGGMMEAQDLSRPNGKIFRLHDDGRVPAGNPFVEVADANPGIWTYGHRNPQGLVIDPRDGAIYSTEHGPRGGDELNLIRPGLNYGWPVITYGMNYDGTPMTSLTEKEGMEQPLLYWVPSIAACGLDLYTGERFPKWEHDLFAGGLGQQEVRRIRVKDGKVEHQELVLKNLGRVRDVATGPDGFIYILLNDPDRVVRMVPAE